MTCTGSRRKRLAAPSAEVTRALSAGLSLAMGIERTASSRAALLLVAWLAGPAASAVPAVQIRIARLANRKLNGRKLPRGAQAAGLARSLCAQAHTTADRRVMFSPQAKSPRPAALVTFHPGAAGLAGYTDVRSFSARRSRRGQPKSDDARSILSGR